MGKAVTRNINKPGPKNLKLSYMSPRMTNEAVGKFLNLSHNVNSFIIDHQLYYQYTFCSLFLNRFFPGANTITRETVTCVADFPYPFSRFLYVCFEYHAVVHDERARVSTMQLFSMCIWRAVKRPFLGLRC